MAVPVGSSPLARGLPEAARDLPLGGRIIPARAGFTVMPRSITAALKDHPRSRGVYSTLFDANWAVMGSSPLARGLPDATNKFKNTLRDHPRSRGVYFMSALTGMRIRGSSPLARGLLAGAEESV